MQAATVHDGAPPLAIEPIHFSYSQRLSEPEHAIFSFLPATGPLQVDISYYFTKRLPTRWQVRIKSRHTMMIYGRAPYFHSDLFCNEQRFNLEPMFTFKLTSGEIRNVRCILDHQAVPIILERYKTF